MPSGSPCTTGMEPVMPIVIPPLGRAGVGDVQIAEGRWEVPLHPESAAGDVRVVARMRLVISWMGVVAAHTCGEQAVGQGSGSPHLSRLKRRRVQEGVRLSSRLPPNRQ
jgi:hypothetical protein